ncbi:MAG: NAD(P)/FAD-dependent oxidoreductase [Bacteroidetes bacterium]|nr:MAG: NAD(P)/FAD-dependent oxidoreductase [Bacteroidota bacterium]
MTRHCDVLIVGGGLAGCSAAIQLARRGYAVRLVERRRYPAHRLCGEFLSPEVQGQFERLGVAGAVRAAGARAIDTFWLTAPDGRGCRGRLPGTALGLSRYTLDRLLFEAAAGAGAVAEAGRTVRGVAGTLAEGFRVRVDEEEVRARVVLGAFGRRSPLDRVLQRPFLHQSTPWVAFKAHYTGADVAGVIELHAFPGGYCGLSEVEGGRVNVCWIGQADALRAAGGRPEAYIAQTLCRNPVLAERFGAMTRLTPSFEAVSQITFRVKGTFAGDVALLGDAAGMIAPLCGDGMAMALRSAELVVPPVESLLAGTLGPEAFREAYDRAWQQEFRARLRLGRWLHRAGERPALARLAVGTLARWPRLGAWLVRQTRGTA